MSIAITRTSFVQEKGNCMSMSEEQSTWAKQKTDQCIHACRLNLNLVKLGLWDKSFMQMKTSAEVEAYDIFLVSLTEIKQRSIEIEERLSKLDGH